VNKTEAATFAEELAISIGLAVTDIGVQNTIGSQDYVAVILLTHGPDGLHVDGVSVVAGSHTEGLNMRHPRTYLGTSS